MNVLRRFARPTPNWYQSIEQFPAVPAEAAVAAVLGTGRVALAGGGVAAAGGRPVRGEGSVGGRAAPERVHGRGAGAGRAHSFFFVHLAGGCLVGVASVWHL